MKPLSYSLIAAALACGFANAQTTAVTTPVGYVTHVLKPGQANLIGLTLQSPVKSAGIITAESASPKSVTVGTTDFVALLGTPTDPMTPPLLTYILELDGGTVQEITNWTNAGVLYTPDDITGYVVPDVTKFKLRPAATVSSVFGLHNEAGLTSSPDGNAAACDNILLLNAAGTAFDTVYYFDDGTATGWYDLDNAEVSGRAIVYPDGLYVRRVAGVEKNLVVSGEVKTVPTTTVLIPGNNFAGSVYPVGSTLGNSGISSGLIASTDGNTATCDTVLLTKPDGSYGTYYFFNDGTASGWYDLDNILSDDTPLTSGMVIQSKSTVAKNATIAPPSFYSTL